MEEEKFSMLECMRESRGKKELSMLQKLSEWLEYQEAGNGHEVKIVTK